MKSFRSLAAVAGASLLVSSCQGRATEKESAAAADYSVQTQLAAFRSGIENPPQRLAGASSIDSLVQSFASALSRRDSTSLGDLQITRAEFAYLYYPDSKLSHPPYELDPQTMWMQIEFRRDEALHRLLERYGGSRIHVRSLECRMPERQNGITIHECAVRTKARAAPQQLFGSIVERDGWFKFVGFANRL